MIDKKTLILAAAMVPMLGLANVGAIDWAKGRASTPERSYIPDIDDPDLLRHNSVQFSPTYFGQMLLQFLQKHPNLDAPSRIYANLFTLCIRGGGQLTQGGEKTSKSDLYKYREILMHGNRADALLMLALNIEPTSLILQCIKMLHNIKQGINMMHDVNLNAEH